MMNVYTDLLTEQIVDRPVFYYTGLRDGNHPGRRRTGGRRKFFSH